MWKSHQLDALFVLVHTLKRAEMSNSNFCTITPNYYSVVYNLVNQLARNHFGKERFLQIYIMELHRQFYSKKINLSWELTYVPFLTAHTIFVAVL